MCNGCYKSQNQGSVYLMSCGVQTAFVLIACRRCGPAQSHKGLQKIDTVEMHHLQHQEVVCSLVFPQRQVIHCPSGIATRNIMKAHTVPIFNAGMLEMQLITFGPPDCETFRSRSRIYTGMKILQDVLIGTCMKRCISNSKLPSGLVPMMASACSCAPTHQPQHAELQPGRNKHNL